MTADTPPIDLTKLPTQWRLLVACIGFAETTKLIKARGGTVIKIPVRTYHPTYLTEIISEESVVMLVKQYPGKAFELPKFDKVAQQLRNLEIMQERQISSASRVALKFNLSKRMILYIAPLKDNNVDLFEEKI